ncbi:bis(5'-nucleosyl)-tetraphosphatase (symmetrical) YqeK [Paenibacillus sp. PsM32]|uniref:bis(5'-nucleosyl)-tetraphosphatase (symmetrical) n=1 Tax=Paenibacillus kyungheensis TaxID=1452732 RepID=A0AAX3LZP6_9BACL|nr:MULTISPECIES: bis(5'-nucleosyl)-tetraphosphatase (symmetrical) YqeK [Paenibacillus]MDN4618993.1 bis(5'-nucleosyl)-tetraphosphatase (symmetrical) YqeK [Paenibacillus sp. PsM32]MDQ1235089.1 putative HD superfamily hydrolase involved in NAD metabolism [Paenibacillus sp. SORGH_AS_0306]MDR6112137.1 putative HD superfamily hydrolase involved in NAD metabolism [Paenibacillus sp. SORGH_AS_0338]WCT54658.1 bis(5'-nucleosyl)-tetraphosphatase (symmetrical) YqeK [Paenibacillus kyungheensis]WDF52199.1 bi
MNLTRDELKASVSAQMPQKRWKHTEGVMQSAIVLAKRYGADPVKAEIAAILHDVAKYWSTERQEQVLREQALNDELLLYDKPLWHAEVGAYTAQTEYGVDDEEILNAIRYHTSGRVGMTVLEKVICLADYIEPGRDFPGVDHIRSLAEHSLEAGLVAGFDSTIHLLLARRQVIFPLTVLSRNDLVKQLELEGEL